MTPVALRSSQTQLDSKIYALAQKLYPNEKLRDPVTDGVCDEEAYLASNPKIMWILKEPYDDFDDEGNPCGGGWSTPKNCFIKDDVWAQKSWQNIVYTMQGIIEGKEWNEIPYTRDNRENAKKMMQRIAYLNVSKMPNGRSSSDAFIARAYQDWKPILFEQIELYNPDVIIFGRTFHCFKADLVGTDAEPFKVYDESARVFKADGRLFVDTGHPARKFGKKGEVYVNAIIKAVRENL